MDDILEEVIEHSKRYQANTKSRSVAPSPQAIDKLKQFDKPLQDNPIAPIEVLSELDSVGSPATVASTGGRYFGFVVGGSLPAALAANILAGVWVHVDGAFGLWAAVSPKYAYLVKGIKDADSWATDAHKWLNVHKFQELARHEKRTIPSHLGLESSYLA